MRRNCVTIMSDRDSRTYVVPTAKEPAFNAWEASVIGGDDEEYTGEDFLDYQIDSPLGTLVLTKPYRRFSRRSGTASRRTLSTSRRNGE
jgi:hypothetical protein